MRVFVTGGTGLVGTRLVKKLLERGDQVTLLTRRLAVAKDLFGAGCTPVEGDPTKPGEWMKAASDCDGVIHLAGENIFGKRWGDDFKRLMTDSRVKSTAESRSPPNQMRSATGITTTGQCAWCTTWLLTEPISSLAKPPPPRDPTTIRSAVRDASINSCAGKPMVARTVTEGGWASPSWLRALAVSSSAAWHSLSSSAASRGSLIGLPVHPSIGTE